MVNKCDIIAVPMVVVITFSLEPRSVCFRISIRVSHTFNEIG